MTALITCTYPPADGYTAWQYICAFSALFRPRTQGKISILIHLLAASMRECLYQSCNHRTPPVPLWNHDNQSGALGPKEDRNWP